MPKPQSYRTLEGAPTNVNTETLCNFFYEGRKGGGCRRDITGEEKQVIRNFLSIGVFFFFSEVTEFQLLRNELKRDKRM